jgi:CO/xanthine dehydrogenase Mo-binding subunit
MSRRRKRHPGVVDVMTTAHKPPLAIDPEIKTNPFVFRMEVLQSDEVRYANQPIAVVIAETLEAATEGAALLAPRYETLPARRRSRRRRELRAAVVGVGNPDRESARRYRSRACRGVEDGSRRPMRRRRNITTRWSRMRSSRRGTATACRSIRRARRW